MEIWHRNTSRKRRNSGNCFVYKIKGSLSGVKGEAYFGDEQHKREPQSDSPSDSFKHSKKLARLLRYNILKTTHRGGIFTMVIEVTNHLVITTFFIMVTRGQLYQPISMRSAPALKSR